MTNEPLAELQRHGIEIHLLRTMVFTLYNCTPAPDQQKVLEAVQTIAANALDAAPGNTPMDYINNLRTTADRYAETLKHLPKKAPPGRYSAPTA